MNQPTPTTLPETWVLGELDLCQVVAMHDLLIRAMAEDLGDAIRLEALDAFDLGGGIVRQAARKFSALCVAQGNDVSLRERAFDATDANC